MTKRNDTSYRSRSNSRKKYPKTIHKRDIALHLEIALVMTKVLLLNNTVDHDMTTIKDIRGPIALRTDLLQIHLQT